MAHEALQDPLPKPGVSVHSSPSLCSNTLAFCFPRTNQDIAGAFSGRGLCTFILPPSLQYPGVEREGISWFWDVSSPMFWGWKWEKDKQFLTSLPVVVQAVTHLSLVNTNLPLISAVRLTLRCSLLHGVHTCEVCRGLSRASSSWLLQTPLAPGHGSSHHSFLLLGNPCPGTGLPGWATIKTAQAQWCPPKSNQIYKKYPSLPHRMGHRLPYSCPSLHSATSFQCSVGGTGKVNKSAS